MAAWLMEPEIDVLIILVAGSLPRATSGKRANGPLFVRFGTNLNAGSVAILPPVVKPIAESPAA